MKGEVPWRELLIWKKTGKNCKEPSSGAIINLGTNVRKLVEIKSGRASKEIKNWKEPHWRKQGRTERSHWEELKLTWIRLEENWK